MARTHESERRIHTRYAVPAMYTAVAVRRTDEDAFGLFGHAYDLSEGGMRFEVDQPLPEGAEIEVRLQLPGGSAGWTGHRPVYATARVVWLEEEDVELGAGPVRMACAFSRFQHPGDAQRLRLALGSGRFAAAA
jgi:hypothetical protein